MTARSGCGALALALACGLPDPAPLARVTGASPEGSAVPVGASAQISFSAPVDGDGLVDGRRLVLTESAGVAQAVAAVESDAGAAGLGVAVRGALEDGGRRVVLRPEGALRAFTGHALVLSSRARAADGRPVLDPDGRHRTFVATFATGPPEGPPPTPVLTEVRVDAEAPEAGGEYVEVANAGDGPLDLAGFRLAKRTAGGALASCGISAVGGVASLPPGGVALVAGGGYDGRYPLPAGVPVLACGATALLGGIANDRGPELLLSDPAGTVLATLGANGAPVCPSAIEKIDPGGMDDPENLACTDGTPGVL